MIRAALVSPDQVHIVWDQVVPYMERAAEYTYGRYELSDIKDVIEQYDHNLWIAFDDKGLKGAVVTAFKHYPRKKYLDLVFVGGDEGLEWKDPMLKILQHWAYDNTCDGIESSGRLGWSKIFKDDGYKPLWQTYELPVADTGLGV
jgi:hypothetical protein